MRRASLALSFLSLLFVFFMNPTRGNAQNNSQIFSETGYDFKGIPRYTMPRHSFIFTNNGSEDLKLVSARVSCQCTKVFIPQKRVYKPGEKGEVAAQIDGVRFTGVRHVTVTVTFQRGSSVFEIPLNISGVIIENVSLNPQKLTFLVDQEIKPQLDTKDGTVQINPTDTVRTKQAMVVYPGYNETISRVTSSSPFLEVQTGKPVRSSNGGTQTPLYVTVKNDAPAGYIDANVQIWSNGASGGTPLVLNVSGVVRAPLTASPGTLTFFTSEEGEKITKNFVVSAPSEFTLKAVQSPSKAVVCKFSPAAVRPAKVCVVPVTFDPSLVSDASENLKLKIETTDGRILFLDVQISSGNFDSSKVEPKNTAEKTDDSKTEDAEKISQQTEEKDDFSNAKISVSGAKKNEDRALSPTSIAGRRQDVTPMTIPSPTPTPRSSRYQPMPLGRVAPFSLYR